MSCLLNRTILHLQSVRTVSSLNTNQIFKSRVVFKSQYLLICGRILNVYGIHTFCLRGRGFRLVSSYKTTLYVTVFSYEYLRRISREGRNSYPSCLNDEQLLDASSPRASSGLLRRHFRVLQHCSLRSLIDFLSLIDSFFLSSYSY